MQENKNNLYTFNSDNSKIKIFLKHTLTFISLPIILLVIAENIISPTTFTFRVWEAIIPKSELFIGAFYPNVRYQMFEKGDLANHTNFAIKKSVIWETDNIGFRNKKLIKKPEILLIGDSTIAGCSLSQNETLTYILNKQNKETYNIAPADINKFVELKNAKIISSPKYIIFAAIERKLLTLPPLNKSSQIIMPQIRQSKLFQTFSIFFDKTYRANSLRYMKSRLTNKYKFRGIQAPNEKKLFFLRGKNATYPKSNAQINRIVKTLKNYAEYCQANGSKFIFLPIPNKETILWKKLDLKFQPNFINKLFQKLRKENIPYIDTIKIFNHAITNNIMPYHYDDSHWNYSGVKLVAMEILPLIN